MIDYSYTDKDGDIIQISKEFSRKNTAYLDTDGCDVGIYIPAEEAPKTAQALLEASGAKAVVVVGELPKVSETFWGDFCVVNGNTYSCDLNYLDRAVLELLAVKSHVQAREAKEKEAAEKLAARRDAIIKDVFGVNFYYEGYSAGAPLRKAVDRIIELEDGK